MNSVIKYGQEKSSPFTYSRLAFDTTLSWLTPPLSGDIKVVSHLYNLLQVGVTPINNTMFGSPYI